ncbi:hypothetical protein SAMN05421594_1444 [Chryseobacterium oleae]|uniref:Uncharacterized protein n=1 Tax=Chryseobacterium oleae TaxID=491207 RepID=A0A1I4WQP9_CHROL|nr:hypothetical protein [Chryseobacterium oleae]SFN15885.1 hypothetical protein SAMN05421594_1444 [Chryseobacterium oleae]
MRIKIFSSMSANKTEKEVNDFLATTTYEIIDIKWACDGTYAVMVIFKM